MIFKVRYSKGFPILLMVLSLTLMGATSTKKPKSKKDRYSEADPRFSLSTGVPMDSEKGTYRVTGSLDGKQIYPTGVPLYTFEEDDFGGYSGEDIPVGTTIKLEVFRGFKLRHFYGVPREVKMKNGLSIKKWLWVDGLFIEKAS